MGAWGVYSDENDWTYDWLGMGIGDRASGVSLKKLPAKELAALNADMKKQLKKIAKKAPEAITGVARWALKNGLKVEIQYLKVALKHLQEELEQLQAGNNAMGWREPRQRIAAIKKELQELAYAQKHKGYGKRGPTYGIFGRSKRKGQ